MYVILIRLDIKHRTEIGVVREKKNKTHSIKDTIAFNSGYRLDNGCYWLVNLSLIINNYEYNITHF